ncbi:MAG TPA: chlorite dismutase family protein [Thermoplasmata archaeon]|nr:chlorite dismutase family protein [Thermoplasmata archaeon]
MTDQPAADTDEEGPRDFVRYSFWALRPEWRRKPAKEREQDLRDLEHRLTHPPTDLTVRTYSLVGTKSGVHGLLWLMCPRLEAFQEFESRLWGGGLGGYLDFPYGYFGMGRRSEYLGAHAHAGQETATVRPSDRRYLFVYPFVKKREWYALSFEERRRIMVEHFQIGHKFPAVQIHTGYSFGLDDAEFILAFEGDSPGEFLDLVQALRPSVASRFTALETPIFTCVAVSPRRMIDLAAGLP